MDSLFCFWKSEREGGPEEKKNLYRCQTLNKEGFFYFGVNSLQTAPCSCPICKFIKRESLFFPYSETFQLLAELQSGIRVTYNETEIQYL